MANRTEVLIFGDLTGDFRTGLGRLAAGKDNPLLTSFFEQVAFVIRAELGTLSVREREDKGFVQFTSIVDLLAKLRDVPNPHPALEKALTCTHQLASFISRYAGAGQTFPTPSETRIIGLCTGLLTSAAVSCCQSLTDLIPIAVHTVLVAFRTGLCVAEVRNRIELPDSTSSSWSVMIPGLSGGDALKVLDKFSRDKGFPVMSRPYVSAYADNGITLSGPPKVLDDLLQSNRLPQSSSLRIRIHAPFHAAHLYDSTDLDAILKPTLNLKEFASTPHMIPIASSISGKNISATSYGPLLRSVLVEILLEPLRLDRLSGALAKDLEDAAPSSCTIFPVATSASQTFASALRRVGLANVSVDESLNKSTAPKGGDTSSSGNLGQSKLAIIGFSGRFPDADDNEAFWRLLHEGRDVASEAPKTRWNVETHVDPTGKRKNTSATPFGCWLQDAGLFDARFFGVSPREAPQVDPAQRLSLLTAYEAIEHAGLVPGATPSTQRDRVGVFTGASSNDWGETNSAQDIDTYYIPGSCRAFIPGKVNYHFKFSGPSLCIDTACSSSLAAMHMACNALWRGDIDTAVCGGTNVTTNPDITAGLDRGHFLSRTGNCKTFDDGADGYCRGEGVCTVIIKRIEDAIADNDPIVAVLEGAYTNHSADAESITRPHVGAQRAIFDRVLTSAGVSPYDVGYVEMHGTGTQTGDAREMESVLATFANRSFAKVRNEAETLYLGSAKSNIGHGEGVSGIIALIKVLLMLEKNEIPPHCGIKSKINSKFPTDFKERNTHIALNPTPWHRPEGRPRRAFINNFSAAGGNSSVLVADAPIRPKLEQEDPRSIHMVALTAKSKTAIADNVKSLLGFIKNKSPSLPSLSYTTTARRTHHPYRVMASGSNLAEISSQLENALVSVETRTWPKGVPSVAFAFTGQGSQYPGMAKELLRFSTFRKDFERFDSMAQKQGFPSIMPVVQDSAGEISDFAPLVVQLASTCMQMAMARLWQSWGIEPIAVVGHSLGEYAALNVAGVLSDADTIYLTGKRAQLLQAKCTRDTHSMLAVNSSVVELQKMLEGMRFEIACKNAPTETVLSGTNEQIDKIHEVLASSGLKKTRLRVPYAFHSSQVEVILEEFEDAARGATFDIPKVPVLCPLLGEVVSSGGVFNPSYLARHCREAVDFVGSIEAAKLNVLSKNVTWVELGPHPVVSGLLRTNLGSVTVLPTLQRNKDTWKVLAGSLSNLYTSGADIRWAEYQRDFQDSLSVLRLPSYSWELKNYWMQYVNDWSLYKGDALFLSGSQAPGMSTTCAQNLIEEKVDGDKITVVAESDLMREDLDPIVRGHRVNGVALCTPSMYADMALTLGEYLRKQKPQWENCLVDVQHMDVQRPLATQSKGKGSQLLRCRVILDTSAEKGAVEFYSVTKEGKKLTKHAECSITFPDAKEASSEYRENAVAILSRMAEMRKSIASDDRVQKMNRKSGYHMVSSLASYDAEYQGVEEIILDSANKEATAKVHFNKPSNKGTYQVNPYIIDNFGQPALFIMNANDEADLDKEVFVNHGWTSLHFYKPVSIDKSYRSYVKMTGPGEDGMYKGDMVVFEGDEVVAAYKGVKAQGVPRRLMDYIVHMRDDTKTGPPRAGTQGLAQSAQATSTVQTNTATIQIGVAAPASSGGGSWQDALTIIAEESGVPISDLKSESVFSELGVDSLLSLLCASRFREELGYDYESSIFADYPTVKEMEAFWHGAAGEKPSGGVSGNDAILNSMFKDEPESEPETTSAGSSSDDADPFELVTKGSKHSSSSSLSQSPVHSPKLSAASLLLQGNPALASTTKTLFLLPDGSGSSSSYASLPRMHSSIAVVGMNCPYMKIPEQYDQGIEKVSAMYINEIRRRQPNGPYALGGWSVGGIFAFHVAQQLSAQGEQVSNLVLIDCPVPRGLDHLPKRYYEYCDKIGLLGEGPHGVKRAPPQWLIPHFEACVNSLHSYHGVPFDPATAPKTQIIWACDAIDRHCEPKFDKMPGDPEGLKFLTEARTDFGPAGWETLLPKGKIEISSVKDGNHFSMMKGENAKRLSGFIEAALLG